MKILDRNMYNSVHVAAQRPPYMRIFLSMFASFFACAFAIRLMDRIFNDKPDELLTLSLSLLVAIATGLEISVSMIKKHFGAD